MLIDLGMLIHKYGLNITGVLHVGAHACEEKVIYDTYGLTDDKVMWIEGDPDKVKHQRHRAKNLYQALVSDVDDKEVDFIITNNFGGSSSILELKEHLVHHPDIYEVCRKKLKTTRLDTFLKTHEFTFNFINLDIQGAELLALKGLGYRLNDVDYIYTEVNQDFIYKDCCLIWDIDIYLKKFGFERVETDITEFDWGDAFYLKRKAS